MNNKEAKNKHTNKEFKITEITPNSLECVAGPCPAIFETNNSTFIIIGKVLNKQQNKLLPKGKVGTGETAVEIKKEFITELFDKND